MTASEFEETIFRLLRTEPFVPFEVELTDGRVIHVEIPDHIATSGPNAVFWKFDDEGLIDLYPSNTLRMTALTSAAK